MTAQVVPVEPTRQAVAVQGRSRAGRVTGKLRTAIDDMVWAGSRRLQAAERAGMTDHSLRCALNKPHVKAYYREQLDVLRDSVLARSIHALSEVQEQTENQQARVNAASKLLERGEQQMAGRGSQHAAGLVVVIQGAATVNSLISNDAASPARTSDVSNTLLNLDPSRGVGGKLSGG